MDFLTPVLEWAGNNLLVLVLGPLVAAVSNFVIKLIKAQLDKVGLELTEKQEAAIRQAIRDAIARVEELRRQQAKARVPVLTADEALNHAMMDAAAALPNVSVPEIRSRIHAELPGMRKQLSIDVTKPAGGRR